MLAFSSMRKSLGFSLVELMAAIAILGIVMVFAMPSYRDWIQNTRIRTAAESIQNGLQIARAEAVKRNTRIRFTLGVNPAWTVGCSPADVTVDCPAVMQSEGSSANIIANPVPAGSNIVEFNNFGGVNAAPVPFTEVNVDSTALPPASSRNLRVTLGVAGTTRMCDPEIAPASADPRKC